MVKFIFMLVIIATLSGCQTEERTTPLRVNPEITEVGTFENCTVKYVDRGYKDISFYIAKCGTTSTVTKNYSELQGGKTTVWRRSTTISQEIDKLEEEKKQAILYENAMNKLSKEEQDIINAGKK